MRMRQCRYRSKWRRFLEKDEQGSAALEFALILPVFLIILFGIIQFGYLFVVQNSMTNAAREGVRAIAIQQVEPAQGVALVRDALAMWGVDFQIDADTQVDPAGRNEVSIVVSLPLDAIAFGDFIGISDGRRVESVATMRQD